MEGSAGGIDPESQRAGSDPEVGSDLRLASGTLNALTDVPGIEVGHYTHDRVQRGVTAILCRAGATAGSRFAALTRGPSTPMASPRRRPVALSTA